MKTDQSDTVIALTQTPSHVHLEVCTANFEHCWTVNMSSFINGTTFMFGILLFLTLLNLALTINERRKH